MHIDKDIEIPNDYYELFESFIEKFGEDENKDYLFFFKDNDNVKNEDVKDKYYIKNDVCYSDFIDKKKYLLRNLKKKKKKKKIQKQK